MNEYLVTYKRTGDGKYARLVIHGHDIHDAISDADTSLSVYVSGGVEILSVIKQGDSA